MIVDMMKHFYVFRNCQMSASSCDGVVAIVFLWDAVCIGLGGSFRMPNPINIDVEFDPDLAAKSEFGYYKHIFLGFGEGAREETYFHAFRPQWSAASS